MRRCSVCGYAPYVAELFGNQFWRRNLGDWLCWTCFYWATVTIQRLERK